MPLAQTDRLLNVIGGCQRLLARRGVDREAFTLGYIVHLYLEALRALHTGEPFYNDYEKFAAFPLLFYAIRIKKGSQVQAAKALGISRNTLRSRLAIARKHPRLVKLAKEMGCEDLVRPPRRIGQIEYQR